MVLVRLGSIIDDRLTTKAEWSEFHAFQLVRTLFVALLQPFLWSATTMQTERWYDKWYQVRFVVGFSQSRIANWNLKAQNYS